MYVFARDIFVLGLFLIMIFYNLFYCFLRKDKYLLLFVVLNVLLISKTLISGSYIISSLSPTVDFRIYVWLTYLPLCCMPSICLMVFGHYFSVNISKKVVWASLTFSAAGAVAALVLPTYLFTKLTYVLIICIMLPVIYGTWKLVKALIGTDIKKSLDILFMAIGILAILVCAGRDIMYNENLIKVGHADSLPIGSVIFIMLWDMSITYRYELLSRDRLRVLRELNDSNERERAIELRFLRSQIRPHFINNALNTIISISRNDSDKARTLLVQFSKYLRSRYDFEKLDDLIPIGQEFEYVRAYLAIESARFGDKLYVEFEIDESDIRVPPLVLQPLVENAVIHGIRGNQEIGRILIYVKPEKEYFRIGVKDNGPGMRTEDIEEVLSGTSAKRGVALHNINERVRKLYHTGLTIICPSEGGLDVSVLIPKEKEAHNESSGN